MNKFTISVGRRSNGQLDVILPPSDSPDQHRDHLRGLTDNGGSLKDGKSIVQYSEAVVLHSTKGILASRKFAKQPKQSKKAD